ncbi:MAG: hypothetical protein ACQER1_12425 [Armatimonadota bacterium]
MADINLDFLSPEKREFLRRRLQARDSLLESQIERLVDAAMEPESTILNLDGDEDAMTPEELGRAREGDRALTEALRKAAGGKEEGSLRSIAGMVKGENAVTSENFHEYLYGEWDEEQ